MGLLNTMVMAVRTLNLLFSRSSLLARLPQSFLFGCSTVLTFAAVFLSGITVEPDFALARALSSSTQICWCTLSIRASIVRGGIIVIESLNLFLTGRTLLYCAMVRFVGPSPIWLKVSQYQLLQDLNVSLSPMSMKSS